MRYGVYKIEVYDIWCVRNLSIRNWFYRNWSVYGIESVRDVPPPLKICLVGRCAHGSPRKIPRIENILEKGRTFPCKILTITCARAGLLSSWCVCFAQVNISRPKSEHFKSKARYQACSSFTPLKFGGFLSSLDSYTKQSKSSCVWFMHSNKWRLRIWAILARDWVFSDVSPVGPWHWIPIFFYFINFKMRQGSGTEELLLMT